MSSALEKHLRPARALRQVETTDSLHFFPDVCEIIHLYNEIIFGVVVNYFVHLL